MALLHKGEYKMTTMDSFQGAISRREALVRLAGIGGGAFLLTSCGSSATSSGAFTMNFWTPGGSKTFCAMQGTIEQNYAQSHPNFHAGTVKCGTGQQDFNEVLLARIAAGNPPDATIIWDTPVSLGARGALMPLDQMMQGSKNSQSSNWPSGLLASCQYNGKTYGLPVTAGTYAMWFNQALFEKKGISTKRADFPKTWDELRRLSKEFTYWKGDTLVTAGFLPPYGPSNYSNDQYHLPIWSALNGSQLYDAAKRKYTIDSDANIAMLDYFLSWFKDEYHGDINKVLSSGSAWGVYPDPVNQPPAFQQNRLAMTMEGSWAMGDVYTQATPDFGRWEVAYLPVGPGGSKTASGAWPNWVVLPRGSAHAQEAFAYLDYLGVDGISTWFNVNPDLPTNKKASHLLAPKVVVEKRGQAFAEDVTNFFIQMEDIVVPMWDSPIQSFAADQISQALESVTRKTATPKQALQTAQKACQDNLTSLLSQ